MEGELKTVRPQLRHESMKCKVTTKKAEMVDNRMRMGGGIEEGWCEGNNPPPQTQRPLLIVPVFLDVEVPLPGQVVMLVVVGKLGFDDVVAAGQHAFRSLLHRGQEVVFIRARAVAAHHVV